MWFRALVTFLARARRAPRRISRPHVVEVEMPNLSLSAFQRKEFIVGSAVAAFPVGALVAIHRPGARSRCGGPALSPARRAGADRHVADGGEGNLRVAGFLQRADRGFGGVGGVPARHAEAVGTAPSGYD